MNGAAPTYSELHSEWMTVGAANLAPSPFSRDSFEVGPVTVSQAGARYLQIAHRVDATFEELEDEALKWTVKTQQTPITSARLKAVAATGRFIAAVEHAQWPRSADSLIRLLVTTNRALLTTLRAGPSATRHGFSQWKDVWLKDLDVLGNAAQAVRRALRVPQVEP
jgi:hypothetical protein